LPGRRGRLVDLAAICCRITVRQRASGYPHYIAKFEQQAERGAAEIGSERGGKNVALVADHEISEDVAHEIAELFGADVHLALIAPAVTKTRLEHAAGNADDARAEAEGRIEQSLPALEHEGLQKPDPAAVGDQDPVVAIEDALREFRDVDEVVFVTNSGAAERWAEHDAFDRVRQRVGVPVTHIEVGDDGRLVDEERSDPGVDPPEDPEVRGKGGNLPPFSRQDFLAVVVAIVGTLLLLVIAAINISQADNPGAGLETGDLIAALLALGFFLINTWHVVAIFMFESVGYRGEGAKLFAGLSLYGTPLALIVSLLVTS